MRLRLLPVLGLAVVSVGACSADDAAAPAEPLVVRDGGRSDIDANVPHDGGAKDAPLDVDAGPSLPGVQDGALLGGPGPTPGAIAGITYRSGAQQGVTDAKGAFRFETGGTITFSLAGVELATVPARAKLSPFALAGATCNVTSALRRALVTLETLDGDADPQTGIAIPALATPANENRKLTGMSDGDFATWLSGLSTGRAPADADAALERMIRQVDDEAWSKTADVTFDSVTSASRSQGIATDGASFFFSWTLGLSRTDKNLATQTSKAAAIPLDMLVAGSNHIGDIDVYGGTLYAPVEDGSKYAHPTVVLYDAQSLDPKGARFELPTTMLTKGVPWIAVDGPRGHAYVAEWDPTPAIFELDLQTFSLTRTITLSTPLGRIQGAKVAGHALYLASDDADKTVYKMELDTGIVFPALFSYGSNVVKELEGLVAVTGATASDLSLRVLGVGAGGSSVTLFTHTRTRAPLRAEACAP